MLFVFERLEIGMRPDAARGDFGWALLARSCFSLIGEPNICLGWLERILKSVMM